MSGTKTFDLIVIETGVAASTVAWKCHSAGWSVAVIDSRPICGTYLCKYYKYSYDLHMVRTDLSFCPLCTQPLSVHLSHALPLLVLVVYHR